MSGTLRVTVDAASLAFPRRSGVGRYLKSVLARLVAAHGAEARFVLLAGRPLASPAALDLARHPSVDVETARAAPSLYAWTQYGLARRLRRIRPDVHFSADGLLPPFTRCPSVGVVHDMIWRRSTPWHVRLVMSLRQRPSLAALTVALTDSQATRDAVIRAYGAAGERLRVVPLGVDAALFRPRTATDEPAIGEFRRRHGLPPRFAVAVGNLFRHKNLAVALDAAALLRDEGADAPVLAVIGAGRVPDGAAARRDPGGAVRFLGYVSDDDLRVAYRAAELLVFPSLEEGFGLPLLEAMASGIPVLHSGSSSLPEVAGDAGLAFDPHDPADLVRAIRRILGDASLRAALVSRGAERARRFTWDACGDAVWTALVEASSRGRG